jgi:hypothetical protein
LLQADSPVRVGPLIELSKIHDNVQKLLPRHSGGVNFALGLPSSKLPTFSESRNPVNSTSPALRDKTQMHFEYQRWIPAFAGMTVVTKFV